MTKSVYLSLSSIYPPILKEDTALGNMWRIENYADTRKWISMFRQRQEPLLEMQSYSVRLLTWSMIAKSTIKNDPQRVKCQSHNWSRTIGVSGYSFMSESSCSMRNDCCKMGYPSCWLQHLRQIMSVMGWQLPSEDWNNLRVLLFFTLFLIAAVAAEAIMSVQQLLWLDFVGQGW